MYFKKFFKHLHTVNKHRLLVFKLCIRAGIPFRGLVHDLSKYSPSEFFESVKYYNGTKSPLSISKKENGYSKAWLHHKGRNKHHFEYWIDIAAKDKTSIIPYKYTVEMICDSLAAGIIYKGKEWNKEYELEYFNNRKDRDYINEKIINVLTEVYEMVSKIGIKKTINSKNLKIIYNKHTRN